MYLKHYLTLLIIGLIWGSQFIFQELALASFPPIWIGASRSIIGAIILITICHYRGIKSTNNQWVLFSLIGLLEITIPFIFIPWGQQHLTSSTSAILMATSPFYVLLLAHLVLKWVTINKTQIISIIIGCSGFYTLSYPILSLEIGSVSLTGFIAIIFAVACFTVALLLINQIRNEQPIIIARNILLTASLQLIIIVLFSVSPEDQIVSTNAILSLIYLGVVCTALVYWLYVISIQQAGVVFTSLVNFIVPAVGIAIGLMLTNDSGENTIWAALFLILSALFSNQLLPSKHQAYRFLA